MRHPNSRSVPELALFLEGRRVARRAPPALRERVLARARATVAQEEEEEEAVSLASRSRRAATTWLPVSVPVRAGRSRTLIHVAVAASVALTAGAVGATAALRGRIAPLEPPALAKPVLPAPPAHDGRFLARASGARAVAPPPAPIVSRGGGAPSAIYSVGLAAGGFAAGGAAPGIVAPAVARAARFGAELELLQKAHTAYTRGDFSQTLMLVGDHAEKFSRGQLAEQREALRVRSLLDAGRRDEAERAAATFATRFPRSVLLPRIAAE